MMVLLIILAACGLIYPMCWAVVYAMYKIAGGKLNINRWWKKMGI